MDRFNEKLLKVHLPRTISKRSIILYVLYIIEIARSK